MIPVTQTKVVIKNSKGEEVVCGNCFAACIASLLELPITEVPNVEVLFGCKSSDFDWLSVMELFLESKGYKFKNWYGVQPKDKYYLAIGDSPRGVSHCCIYKNGELVHDPHPTREGLLTLEQFQTVERISQKD